MTARILRENVNDSDIEMSEWTHLSTCRMFATENENGFIHTGPNGKISVRQIVDGILTDSAVYEIGIDFGGGSPIAAYCGSTSDLRSRMRDHLSRSIVSGVSYMMWKKILCFFPEDYGLDFVLYWRYRLCPEDELIVQERSLLDNYDYYLNKVHNGEFRFDAVLLVIQNFAEEL